MTTSLSSKERFQVLPSTYFDKGVSPLRDGGGSALGSRLSLLHPKQKSSAHLPNLSKDQAGRVTWQVLTRGTPLDHSCGRVAKLALERRRVQQRCPRGFSSAALGHRPQNRAKGADPRTGTPQRRNVFLPGCFVFSLSWPACGGAFLVPGRWFSLALPLLVPFMFLFTGRGRHVPAPSGRDAGSSSEWAPSQEPELGTDPRTGFFQVSPSMQYVYIFSAMYEEVLFGFGLGYLVIFTTADDFTLKCVGDVVFSQYWVTGHFWFLFSPSPLHVRPTTLTQFPSTMVSFCVTPSFVWLAVTSQCFS